MIQLKKSYTRYYLQLFFYAVAARLKKLQSTIAKKKKLRILR